MYVPCPLPVRTKLVLIIAMLPVKSYLLYSKRPPFLRNYHRHAAYRSPGHKECLLGSPPLTITALIGPVIVIDVHELVKILCSASIERYIFKKYFVLFRNYGYDTYNSSF